MAAELDWILADLKRIKYHGISYIRELTEKIDTAYQYFIFKSIA